MQPLRIRSERFLLGLRGLALLRGWPFGDPSEADDQMERMADVLARDPDLIDIASADVADAYADWSLTYDGPNPLIMAEEPVMRSWFDDLPRGRALDVACGTGRLAAILAELGHEVTGVEPSPAMLARAASKPLDVSWVRGDARALPFGDASFDLATCGLALTHVQDLREPIAEMARVLRPGGSVVLSDIHPIAAATGAHAYFETAEGGLGVTRNEVHWPGEYIQLSLDVGFEVRGCVEPRFEAQHAEQISDPEVREAALTSFVGLPFSIVWLLRKR
jgi:ubiquinone/menaquinone biosynthesis C-methylase UbiE